MLQKKQPSFDSSPVSGTCLRLKHSLGSFPGLSQGSNSSLPQNMDTAVLGMPSHADWVSIRTKEGGKIGILSLLVAFFKESEPFPNKKSNKAGGIHWATAMPTAPFLPRLLTSSTPGGPEAGRRPKISSHRFLDMVSEKNDQFVENGQTKNGP